MIRMLQLLMHMARCRAGNFATLFAILSPVLLGLAGGAVDLVVYNNQETKMQDAADAAVLAATREASLKNWSELEAKSVARAYVEAALADEDLSSSAQFDVTTVIDPVTRKVDITVDMDQHHYFLLGYFRKSPQIRVTAAAKLSSETPVCMIGLDPGASGTISALNKGQIHAEGCSVHSNSTHLRGIFVDTDAHMQSAATCSSGGFGSGVSVFQPAPTTDCPPFADPLAARLQPIAGSCDFTNYAVKKKAVTLSPGVYCGGLHIESQADVTLKPGVYIIKDGTLLASGNGSLKGVGVTIFFTGKAANMDFDGTSKISLTAPVSGPTAGLLLMQDRAMGPQVFEISSQSAAVLLGTVYLPNGKLKVRAPGKVADQSAFTVVVARSVEIGSQAQIFLNSDYSSSAVPVPAGIGASKGVISLVN